MAFSVGLATSPERAIEYELEEVVSAPPKPESAQTPAPVPLEDQRAPLRIFAFGPARVEKEGLPLDSPDWIQKSR